MVLSSSSAAWCRAASPADRSCQTAVRQCSVSGGGPSFRGDGGKNGFLTKPAGNAVNLEDQMLKVSANQMDYAAATSLYSRSLGLLKTAIGKR